MLASKASTPVLSGRSGRHRPRVKLKRRVGTQAKTYEASRTKPVGCRGRIFIQTKSNRMERTGTATTTVVITTSRYRDSARNRHTIVVKKHPSAQLTRPVFKAANSAAIAVVQSVR